MPCGGIYPIEGSWVQQYAKKDEPCYHCNEPGADHWVEEWDAGIHGKCVADFLTTEEGLVIIAHKHDIEVFKTWT